MDDDVLQDFLSEAGELLDALNEELIELENRPDDADILNKAFRAFHTIKGGAGFVGLDPLVDICHRAEEVFSELREGRAHVTPEMMDSLLQTLDVVNAQFTAAREGVEPEPAPPALLTALASFLPGGSAAEKPAAAAPADAAGASSSAADPADAEFDAMFGADPQLAATAAPAPTPEPAAAPAAEPVSDTISDDEFEALLDQLQGAPASRAGAGDAPPAAGAPADAEPGETAGKTADKPAEAASAPPPASGGGAGGNGRGGGNGDGGAAGGGAAKAPETVRVDVARLDAIMNLVGELVLVRNRLNNHSENSSDTSLTSIAETLDRVTADVQTAVMESRLQPVRKVFSRFPRLVRDISRELKKPVELVMTGEDTELDKQVLDALSEPLVHLVRNALDHGLEMPEEREALGKPSKGTVYLSAAYVGDRVEIVVREDGRGMDAEKFRKLAVKKGIITPEQAASMDDRDAFDLIFMPGFSTSEQISNISGRGVGMDAVRTKVAELNGRVEIHSEPNVGSAFTISVPLTLAILPTLMVKVSEQRFALPLTSVKEVCELEQGAIHVVNGQRVMIIREQPLPLHRAHEYLRLPPPEREEDAPPEVVVVLELESRRVGFVVDEILGQEEAVLKPLGAYVRDLPGLGGGTVTGDGGIALILDVGDLLRKATPLISNVCAAEPEQVSAPDPEAVCEA